MTKRLNSTSIMPSRVVPSLARQKAGPALLLSHSLVSHVKFLHTVNKVSRSHLEHGEENRIVNRDKQHPSAKATKTEQDY